jgi:hypothetical protein
MEWPAAGGELTGTQSVALAGVGARKSLNVVPYLARIAS